MELKEEYYIKVLDFCKSLNIEVPDKKDTEALKEIIKRMKSVGLL